MAGGMYVVSGQPAEASPLFDRALTIEPSHPLALFELANIKLAEHAAAASVPLFIRSAASLEALLSAGEAQVID